MRSSVVFCAFVAAAAAVPSDFEIWQYEKSLQQRMWQEDHFGKAQVGAVPSAEYFTQRQDHFDGSNGNTWPQAFYTNATFWKGPQSKAPVFLCVGGEGPPIDGSVVVSSVHCNVAVEWLQETGALMFAVEHRYYGCHNSSACPVNSTIVPGAYKYLSSHQALWDLGIFVEYATARYNLTKDNKWVSWGGSYPGMLAGWFRLKFPHLVHASVASSAPVRAELDMHGYNNVVASAYTVSNNGVGGSPTCSSNIADGHRKIGQLFGSSEGRQNLAQLFGHTPDWYNNTENQRAFAGNGVAQFPAQSNNPNCIRPGCGIKQICEVMTNDSLGDNVQKLAELVKHQDTWAKRKWELTEKDTASLGGNFWGYQTCTEFAFYQTCEKGTQCFYTQGLVTLSGMDRFCQQEFGISQDLIARNVQQTNDFYGADKPAGSCVVYPNGEVDPWHANSVLVSPAPSITIIWVLGASHHAWTHPSHPSDQPSVVQARGDIRKTVTSFLSQTCST